jgi:hypothetical protein
MMGQRQVEQAALFYEFSLERHIPTDHVLRSIHRFVELGEANSEAARPRLWSKGSRTGSRCSSLRHFSSFAAFVFACVFDGEDALLAVSAGGLGGQVESLFCRAGLQPSLSCWR